MSRRTQTSRVLALAVVQAALLAGPAAVAGGDCNTNGVPDDVETQVAFTKHVVSTGLGGARSIVADDLDLDGDLDLVVAVYATDQLAWYENLDGDGTFGPLASIALAPGARSVRTADFNQDGRRDLLVGDSSWVRAFEGLGGGSFGGPTFLQSFSDYTSVDAADLDGDGDDDALWVANSVRRIYWSENLGEIGFGEPDQIFGITYMNPHEAHSTLAHDLDGDDDLDVLGIASNSGPWWHRNDGLGDFSSHMFIQQGINMRMVSAADADGDGDQDILVARGDNRLGWFPNLDGQGTFGGNVTIAEVDDPQALHAIDLDHDGDLDYVAAIGDEGVRWYENLDGVGTTFAEHEIDPLLAGAQVLWTGDIDGDLATDLVVSGDGADVVWYERAENDCNGNATPDECDIDAGSLDCNVNGIPDECEPDCNGNWIPDSCDLDAGTSIDCDLDGLPDECEPYCAGIDVPDSCQGPGGEDCNGNSVPDFCDVGSGITADCTGDGIPDECQPDCNGNLTPDVCEIGSGDLLDCNGNYIPDECEPGFGFEEHLISAEVPVARWVDAADVDGDGDQDALTASWIGGKIAWYENLDGLGGFGPQIVVSTQAAGAQSVQAVDLDGDADLDALAASAIDHTVAWYENLDGVGTFGGERLVSTDGDFVRRAYAADLDGDGDADVLSASQNDDRVAWYENLDGLGNFGPQRLITTEADGPQAVYAADLDGDDDLDVLLASAFDDTVAWYENLDGLGGFGPSQILSSMAMGAVDVYAADLDGDGDLDVLSAAETGGETAWYENLGSGQFGLSRTVSTAEAGPRAVRAVDLDGDGALDVLVATTLDDAVVWYANTGGGTFGPAATVVEVSVPYSVDVADFDGDGNPDVAAALSGSGEVAWYRVQDCNANGVADFCDPDCNGNAIPDDCDLAAGAGDCNLDGIPDECEPDCDSDGLPDECEIAAGASDCDADGVPDECEPDCNGNATPDDCDIAMGAGDCDTDGVPDECESDCNANATPDDCDIAAGAGDCDADGVPDECEIAAGAGDCDADGVPDDCEPDCNGNATPDDCDLAMGAGDCDADGVLDECEPDCNGNATPDDCDILMGAGDCDADGIPDECEPDCNGDGTPDACEGDCNGNGTADSCDLVMGADDCDANGILDECELVSDCNGNATLDQCDIAQGASADCNGNAIPDECEAAADPNVDCDGDGVLDVCEPGLAVVVEHLISDEVPVARWVDAADIDGDGDQDALTASWVGGKIAWYENLDGLGGFGPQIVVSSQAAGAQSVQAVDLDGDDDLDALAASASDDTVAWYENLDGAGTFGGEQIVSTAGDFVRRAYAADLDGDGDADVLSASQNDDTVAWFENLDGLGNFGPQRLITTTADGPQAVYAADLDGDGDADVLSASQNDDTVAWFENLDGLGGFGPSEILSSTAMGAVDVYAADLDGDGDLDVLSAAETGGETAWYENLGSGQFGLSRTVSTAEAGPRVVRAVDLDGDGALDVLVAASLDDVVVWYANTGGGTFGPAATVGVASLPYSVDVADFDGDGDPDIAAVAAGPGELVWYQNEGADCDADGVVDFCEPDCDADGTPDVCEILSGDAIDCDANAVPDSCESECVEACDSDGDLCIDTADAAPQDPFVCSDSDADGCEDCSSGTYDPAADGTDADLDGRCDATDCADSDPSAWTPPSAVSTLTVAWQGGQAWLSWAPPSVPGAVSVRYDLLRTTDAADFFGATVCLASDAAETLAVDAEPLASGDLSYYLVRVENDCPAANLGADSEETPRTGRPCP